jgi:hypothetical protein
MDDAGKADADFGFQLEKLSSQGKHPLYLAQFFKGITEKELRSIGADPNLPKRYASVAAAREQIKWFEDSQAQSDAPSAAYMVTADDHPHEASLVAQVAFAGHDASAKSVAPAKRLFGQGDVQLQDSGSRIVSGAIDTDALVRLNQGRGVSRFSDRLLDAIVTVATSAHLEELVLIHRPVPEQELGRFALLEGQVDPLEHGFRPTGEDHVLIAGRAHEGDIYTLDLTAAS